MSTLADEGSCIVGVVTARLVGQLTTGILVASASSTAVEVVDDGRVLEVLEVLEVVEVVEVGTVCGRAVGPVVVGARRSAWGELSAHPAARAATPTRPATRNNRSPNPPLPMP